MLWHAQDPTASLETLLKALPDGSAPKATYVKGDKVEVIAGDLTSLTGEIVGGCGLTLATRVKTHVTRAWEAAAETRTLGAIASLNLYMCAGWCPGLGATRWLAVSYRGGAAAELQLRCLQGSVCCCNSNAVGLSSISTRVLLADTLPNPPQIRNTPPPIKNTHAHTLMLCHCVNTHMHAHTPLPGVVEDTRPEEGKVLVRPDMMKDQVVELELAEVQKKFNVSFVGPGVRPGVWLQHMACVCVIILRGGARSWQRCRRSSTWVGDCVGDLSWVLVGRVVGIGVRGEGCVSAGRGGGPSAIRAMWPSGWLCALL